MDEASVKRCADYLTENHENISAIIRKMDQHKNMPLTESEMFDLRVYFKMQQSWLMRLNQEVNTPTTKQTKKFWKR